MEIQENRYCKNFDAILLKGYDILEKIYVHNKTVVLAYLDTEFTFEHKDMPYLVGFADSYHATILYNGCAYTDYLEAMADYAGRIQKEVELMKAERRRHEFFLKDDCIPDSADDDLTGKLVVLSHMATEPEYTNEWEQLVKVVADEDGDFIMAKTVRDGKNARIYNWEREMVLGVIKPERIPKWAKEKLREMQPKHKNEIER